MHSRSLRRRTHRCWLSAATIFAAVSAHAADLLLGKLEASNEGDKTIVEAALPTDDAGLGPLTVKPDQHSTTSPTP